MVNNMTLAKWLTDNNFSYVEEAEMYEIGQELTEDEAWQSITYYISDLFPNLEVQDHAAGWMRSSWEIQSYAYNTVRTKIEIKRLSVPSTITELNLCNNIAPMFSLILVFISLSSFSA